MAEAVSTQFSIVSGGLACIVGAVVLSALLPGFRRLDGAGSGPHEVTAGAGDDDLGFPPPATGPGPDAP